MCFAAFIVIPLAGVFHWLLRDAPAFSVTADLEADKADRKGSIQALFSAKYRKNSIASMATYFAFGGAYAGSAFYFPTFFSEVKGYSPSEAASLVGMSNFIGIGGYLLAAFVGEYVMTRRNVFILWAIGGTLALLGLLWLSDSRLEDMLLLDILRQSEIP